MKGFTAEWYEARLKRQGNRAETEPKAKRQRKPRRSKPVPSGSLLSREPICLLLPIRIESEPNRRDHWGAKNRRKVSQQEEIRIEWLRLLGKVEVKLPCVVTLSRIAPNTLDDDNNAGGFKGVRDALAQIIGVDDGDERIKWEYSQALSKTYQIRIEVRPL